MRSAKRDHLTRRNLSENELPANFDQQLAQFMEPLLLTCHCLIPIFAAELSLDAYIAAIECVQRRALELACKGGRRARTAGI